MTNEQFELLLQLTSIRSDDIKSAARSVLVYGDPQRSAAQVYGVNEGLLSRRLAVIRDVENIVIKLSPYYSKLQ